jgi:hypothetical protein
MLGIRPEGKPLCMCEHCSSIRRQQEASALRWYLKQQAFCEKEACDVKLAASS